MSYSAIKYGQFSERFKRSIDFFKRRRFRESIQALSDKGIISSTEMVFGIPFPRTLLSKVLKEHHHICDKEILDLYAYLNYEDHEFAYEEGARKDSFSVAELDLYNHITKMFVKLNSKYFNL
jgi:hypothetical protein